MPKSDYSVWYYADLLEDTPRTKEEFAERVDAEERAATLGLTLWWVDVYADLNPASPHGDNLRLMSFGRGTIHVATREPGFDRCHCGYRTVNDGDMERHFVLADRERVGLG